MCFSSQLENQDGHPGLWLAETFSTFPLKQVNRIQRKLDKEPALNVLYQVNVFLANLKTKMVVLADP